MAESKLSKNSCFNYYMQMPCAVTQIIIMAVMYSMDNKANKNVELFPESVATNSTVFLVVLIMSSEVTKCQ